MVRKNAGYHHSLVHSGNSLADSGDKAGFSMDDLKILWSCGVLAFNLYLGCLHIVNLKKYRAAIPLKESPEECPAPWRDF